jgi:hypothetical protein
MYRHMVDPGFDNAVKLFIWMLGAMCLLIIIGIIVAILELIDKLRGK